MRKIATYQDDRLEALQFKGLQLQQLPDFETCFQLNVHVFSCAKMAVLFQCSSRGNVMMIRYISTILEIICHTSRTLLCTQRNTNANYAIECSIT